MKKFDDEILMAYVDSELGEEKRKEVELFLAEDAEARETVKGYRQTRTAIDKFADILDEPVPDHLIDTIRQHDKQSNVVQLPERKNTGLRWMAVAATLVVGVGLGAISMNYLEVKQSENEASITANKIAELSKALEAMKVDIESAEKNTATAEKSAAEAEMALAIGKTKIDNMTKALEIAQAANKKAQEQVLAVIRKKPKEALAVGGKNIFPFKLVAEAIDNGSKLSTDMQRNILSELNTPVATASSFSKLIKKSREEDLTTGASQYESLSDLQPTEMKGAKTTEQIKTREGTLYQPKMVKSIIGEFSFFSKTCRLFEYEIPHATKTSTLLACHSDAGLWEIIQR